jgi:hypothetical protein
MENGRLTIQPKRAEELVKRLYDSGTLAEVMAPEEVNTLLRIGEYLSYLRGFESGGSLSVHGQVGGLMRLRASAAVYVARNSVIARLLMGKGWPAALVNKGAGEKGKMGAVTFLGAIAGADFAAKISQTKEDNYSISGARKNVGDAIGIDDSGLIGMMKRLIGVGTPTQPTDIGNPAPFGSVSP